jgi:hypothetical protein
MAISEVKRLAQALSQEYNSANPDLAKCGQFLSQLKVPPLRGVMWMLGTRATHQHQQQKHAGNGYYGNSNTDSLFFFLRGEKRIDRPY